MKRTNKTLTALFATLPTLALASVPKAGFVNTDASVTLMFSKGDYTEVIRTLSSDNSFDASTRILNSINLCAAHLKLGKTDSAISICRASLASVPSKAIDDLNIKKATALALNNLAVLKIQSDDYATAAALLSKSLKSTHLAIAKANYELVLEKLANSSDVKLAMASNKATDAE